MINFNPMTDIGKLVTVSAIGATFVGRIVGYNFQIPTGMNMSWSGQMQPSKGQTDFMVEVGQLGFSDKSIHFTAFYHPFFLSFTDEPETTKGPSTMNLSTAVLLMNDKCRVIEATYMPDAEGEQRDADGKPRAKRELFKSFDEAIKTGDVLIVPSSTRHKITTVKVTDVDVDWDPDCSTEIKWIIGTVDLAHFEELKTLDEKMFKVIKDAEKTDKRNKLREKLTAVRRARSPARSISGDPWAA